MEVCANGDQKVIEVWMTRAEKNDPVLQEKMRPMYQKWKREGYLVAVFQSGEQDLYQQTYQMLCFNRKRLAELAIQREKHLDYPNLSTSYSEGLSIQC